MWCNVVQCGGVRGIAQGNESRARASRVILCRVIVCRVMACRVKHGM